MNTAWQEFLTSNGAEYENQTLSSFGNLERERRATLGGDIMCDLSHYKILAAVGEDAKTFLQGQLTNDTALINDNSSQISGLCTAKGRLISNFRLFQSESNLFAILPEDLFEKTLSTLQPYILRANVQLGDASDALVQIGISGERATQQLKEHIGELPANPNAVTTHQSLIVIKISEHRYHVLGDMDDCKTLWSHLDVHCTPVSSQLWQLLNIRDGLPEITEKTSEEFIPQMINMDAIDAISYTKGCYTGQEIVARTHYLGKQKRRMYRLHIKTDSQPQTGDELATDTSTGSQYTGTIVTVQSEAGGGGYEALAVVQIKSMETEKLRLKGVESEIELLKLPYSTDKTAD